MMSCVSIIGTLKEIDSQDKNIRYCIINRNYTILKNKIIEDRIPLLNWNKENHGELFSLQENSLVAIKGRIETYRNQVVIVVESIMYLGLKN